MWLHLYRCLGSTETQRAHDSQEAEIKAFETKYTMLGHTPVSSSTIRPHLLVSLSVMPTNSEAINLLIDPYMKSKPSWFTPTKSCLCTWSIRNQIFNKWLILEDTQFSMTLTDFKGYSFYRVLNAFMIHSPKILPLNLVHKGTKPLKSRRKSTQFPNHHIYHNKNLKISKKWVKVVLSVYQPFNKQIPRVPGTFMPNMSSVFLILFLKC